jgi:hypothetical protein
VGRAARSCLHDRSRPTRHGERVRIELVDFFRFDGDRIAERWG